MQYHPFGNTGESLSRIGLGCYGMSGAYGAADEGEAVATIHMATDLGVTLLDTSASYGQGHNHRLIGRAVRDRRHKVFIHSKTGTIRTPDGRSMAEGSGTPERLREMCETSLRNLGVDALDAFCLSRVDPTVPVEESVGGMARLVEEGKTRFIGLSEAAPETVRRAAAVHPLCSLQFEYSLWSRDPESGHIAVARELGMAFMAYAPLGYGMLAGGLATAAAVAGDSRAKFPRLQGENFERNRILIEGLIEIAATRKATPAQLAIAWVLSANPDVFAIPGCKSRRHLEENLAAAEIALDEEVLKKLDRLFPAGAAAGDRYPPDGMRRVNL
jgi:aryl-alcohol dehydrogenase-like predicted oxidoreductase